MWYFYLIGAVLMIVVTVVVRIALCKSIVENKCCFSRVITNILKIIVYFLSLDYYLAYTCKNKHENAKKKEIADDTVKQNNRKSYIKCANHINLVISLFFVVITFILKRFFIDSDWLSKILIGFIGFRFISRTVEINVSFILDCFDRNNNSGLIKWERIKLAFLSLVEEAALFASVYLFLYNGEVFKALLGGLHSFILSPISDKCGVSQEMYGLFSFVTIYQIICSIILITISFATYISDNKEEKK